MQLFDRRTAPRRTDSWFVYCLVDSREPEQIRYIGITVQPRVRLGCHLSKCTNEGWHKSNWIRGVLNEGASILLGVIASGLDHGDATALEVQLIAQHRRVGDKLTNLTDGGDGVTGAKQSDEAKAKKSASLKGRVRSAAHCEAIAAGNRGNRASDRARANMSAAHLKRYEDPAQRRQQAEVTRRRFENPDERIRYREMTLARYADPAEREAQSKRMKEMRRDPEVKLRVLAAKAKAGPQVNNKLGLKGVITDRRSGGYLSNIQEDGRNKRIGRFETAEAAGRAYDYEAIRIYGPEAFTNFPVPMTRGEQ